MARREQRVKKIEPAVLTMNFNIGETNVQYLSLSKAASVLNRRFYRAGLNWAVGGFRFGYSGAPGINVTVSTLPSTWVISGAHEKAFRHWKRQQDEALEDSNSEETKGRFNDFKPFADTLHAGLGGAADMIPVTPGGLAVAAANYLPAEEWLYSEVVIPNDGAPGVTNQYFVTVVGPDTATTKSCVEGYVQSRNTPFSPDPSTDYDVGASWINQMFDVGDDNADITNNAQYRNNELPYDQAVYPQQSGNAGELQLHSEISFTGTTIGNHQNMRGCTVPCGLIRVVHNGIGLEANALTMQVLLVPGEHRGYMASNMLEM
jgi:hypothetical protein